MNSRVTFREISLVNLAKTDPKMIDKVNWKCDACVFLHLGLKKLFGILFAIFKFVLHYVQTCVVANKRYGLVQGDEGCGLTQVFAGWSVNKPRSLRASPGLFAQSCE